MSEAASTREARPAVAASVLVVGVGGLGSAAALELGAARVGSIGLADGDRVELSNLHRQLLHGEADLGRNKAEVAAEKIRRLAPQSEVHAHPEHVTADSGEWLGGYDVVVDATDDPETKFVLSDWAVRAGRPLVHGGVVGLEGQLWTILPGRSACLRCLFPEVPPAAEVVACRDGGVLGPLAALVGALQAAEALKYLDGSGDLLWDRMLRIEARDLRVREVPLFRSPRCPVCGGAPERPARACGGDPAVARKSRRGNRPEESA